MCTPFHTLAHLKVDSTPLSVPLLVTESVAESYLYTHKGARILCFLGRDFWWVPQRIQEGKAAFFQAASSRTEVRSSGECQALLDSLPGFVEGVVVRDAEFRRQKWKRRVGVGRIPRDLNRNS